MSPILLALVASLCVALLSLSGVFFFGHKSGSGRVHRYILPFAVGVFLGVVLFELIPETIEMSHELGPVAIVIGFLGFYLLSYFLHTFHHHHRDESDACVGEGARMLLIGDAVHNVADGVVIAIAFSVNPAVGIATTIGIALHEVPQEVAEFGVLVSSGYTRTRATLYNLLSASSIIAGVMLTFLFIETFPTWLFVLTGIAAGNLLYIATTDLLPELQESHEHHFWQTFTATVLGVVFIASLINVSHEYFGSEEHAQGISENIFTS